MVGISKNGGPFLCTGGPLTIRTGVLMGALIQLARQVLVGLGIGAGLEALLPGQQFAALGPGGGGGFFGVNGAIKRRRRRRKALTAEDMRLMLTIASAVSKKAAENFILQRTRAA